MFHGFGHGAGLGFGLGFLNFVGTVLFVLLVVFAIKALVRGSWRARYDGGPGWRPGWWGGPRWGPPGERWAVHDDEAARIARERLAAGEITAEEYEAIKRGLGSQGGPGQGRLDQALRIARARLARGEIGLEEFEALKRALEA